MIFRKPVGSISPNLICTSGIKGNVSSGLRMQFRNKPYKQNGKKSQTSNISQINSKCLEPQVEFSGYATIHHENEK